MSRNKIYKTRTWKRLRQKVLDMDKGLCQRCFGNYHNIDKKRITKATVVHHHFEVSQYPEYKYQIYVNLNGKKQRNLYSLCFACHEIVHNHRQPKKEDKWDDERWD